MTGLHHCMAALPLERAENHKRGHARPSASAGATPAATFASSEYAHAAVQRQWGVTAGRAVEFHLYLAVKFKFNSDGGS